MAEHTSVGGRVLMCRPSFKCCSRPFPHLRLFNTTIYCTSSTSDLALACLPCVLDCLPACLLSRARSKCTSDLGVGRPTGGKRPATSRSRLGPSCQRWGCFSFSTPSSPLHRYCLYCTCLPTASSLIWLFGYRVGTAVARVWNEVLRIPRCIIV